MAVMIGCLLALVLLAVTVSIPAAAQHDDWSSYNHFIDENESSPPADWKQAILDSNLLYSPTEPSNKEYMASIGNGYAATTVGSSTIYVAGMFNGFYQDQTNPSHRARIPSPIALSLIGEDGLTPSVYAAGLDLQRGVYYRRSAVGGHHVQHSFFAHRADKHLLVSQLSLLSPSGSVSVSVRNAPGPPSDDISLRNYSLPRPAPWLTAIVAHAHETSTTESPWIRVGSTLKAEAPDGQPTRFAIITTRLQSNYTLSPGTTVTFLTSIATSLDDQFQSPPTDAELVTAALTSYNKGRQAAASRQLFSTHSKAWDALWASGGVTLHGRPELSRAVNSSLYYLLSSIRQDRPYSLSPGGLASNGYHGHTFWDAETWMYPGLLLFYPDIGRSMLEYRFDRLSEAHQKALSYNASYNGNMFPWESAFSGLEVCPLVAATGLREQHISGDIAFAARQYYWLTGDNSWAKAQGYPLLSGIAKFWATRVQRNADGSYSINDVIPPDEYHDHVNDSVYTNTVAKISLEAAVELGQALQQPVGANWSHIADNLVILFDAAKQIHPEYQGYDGGTIKQADVVLLGFPLNVPMPRSVRRNDLEYYAPVTDANGPAMTWGMFSVGYLELNDTAKAASYFNQSYANIKAPFGVWTETPSGGTINFITGAGGFLQAAIMGYSGLRVYATNITFTPRLFEGVDSYTLRAVKYHSCSISVTISGSSEAHTPRSTTTLLHPCATELSICDSAVDCTPLVAGHPHATSVATFSVTRISMKRS